MKSRTDLSVVILAAGKGKRMKSDLPKVLFELSGWPLVRHVVEAARPLRALKTVAVVGHGREQVEAVLADTGVDIAVQKDQRGTGHAVRSAAKALKGFSGTILVLLGDVPLIRVGTLRALLNRHRRRKAAATVLTVVMPDPSGYGRILRGEDDRILAIREEKDATAAEKSVAEVNTGIMAFEAEHLWPALSKLKDDNAQGELYLTDVPGLLLGAGRKVEAVIAEELDDVRGVNSLRDLAEVGTAARFRMLSEHMKRGVRIVDPATTYIDMGVEIGKGSTIFPCTVITGDVKIGKGCEVGPFSHLRTGTRLRNGSQIGNFVEVKKTTVGEGTKAKHLTYLGDTEIGRGTNIGCGTITANYDGKFKHRTKIGDGVHVGSGTVFVAPVTIGDRAVTGAGAVVLSGTEVADDETMVGVPARPLSAKKKERR